MANPYEGIDQSIIGEVQNLDIDPTAVTNVISDTVNAVTDQNTINTAEASDSTELALATSTKKVDNYATRKAKNDAFYAWRKLPDGPEKDAAADKWALEYHGTSYANYKKEQDNKKPKNAWEFYKGYSGLGNQEAMMSPAVGGLDWLTDLGNWATKKIRQPLKVPDIPKIPKFDQEGAQAMREISSLVVPFLILRQQAFKAGGNIQASGVAAKYAPWLHRLGNNKSFQFLAKIGLDQGVGVFTDVVNQTNSVNDTLATSWKRGKWWGHQLIPEAWTSDKLGPDAKHRANVLEGMRLGFYTDVTEGIVKLLKASRGVKRVGTEFLTEAGKKSKKLDNLVIDPLDVKVFDEADTTTDSLLRGEAKYERELNSLTEYYQNSNKLDVNTPTVGIHKFSDNAQEGLLTKDFEGILGAAKNQAQIATNTNTTFGRLGNLITEGFRKAGLDENIIANRTLIKSLRDDLIKGGKYSVKLPDGSVMPWKTIDSEGTILAEIISDPTLARGDLLRILDNFRDTTSKLNKVGMNALNKSQKEMLGMWSDINTDKATAYFLTSEAGQIADISEGARLGKDTKAVGRANELLLDRIELFDIESKLHDFNFKGRKDLLAQIQADPANAFRYIDQLDSKYTNKLTKIIPEAKQLRAYLEGIQEASPEFAEAVRLAYEMSDGHVRTIKDLNKHIQNTFGTFNKAFIDTTPEIPSYVYKQLMGNVFNSMLSAIGTPVRALYGNFGGFIAEPVSVFYGALRSGDVQQLRRASHMYFGFTDTFQNGFKYMGKMFRKAAVDPQSLRDFTRKDFDTFVTGKKLNQEIANAAAKKGEYGPQAIQAWGEELEALANHPWLRFGPNAMTGLDGFTQATQKIAMDKAQAFDELLMKYPDGKWADSEFQELWQNLYKKNRDADGFIKSDAVDYARGEIALNLDSPLTKGLNPLLQKVPILRSIMWFPRTQINVLNMFGKYSPRIGTKEFGNIGLNFTSEYAEFMGPFGKKASNEFTMAEKIASLKKRNRYVKSDAPEIVNAKWNHLRNIVQGRAAIGNVAVIGAGMLMAQGRIRGYGHWDPQVQKVRNDQGWERKTIQGFDGKWHSYEALGPLGDWLALTVTIGDNFDSIGTATFEKMEKKMGFILGAAITDQSLLGSIEPLFDIISGNAAAIGRWRTTMENVLFPGASFRNELGKNLFGMLREVKNSDVRELQRNKNNWLDLFDPAGAQAPLINFVDGKPINKAGDSVVARSAKTIFGFGGTASPSPESQFLIDIEFDMLPQFNVASNGVAYTSSEKSELKALMGEDGYFKKELNKIMKDAADVRYVTPDGQRIKGFVNIMRHFRRTGNTEESLETYSRIVPRVESLLRRSMKRVESRLSTYSRIKEEGSLQNQINQSAQSQQSNELNELLEIN